MRSVSKPSVGVEKATAVLESDGSWPQTFPVMRQMFGHRDRAALLGREPDATVDDEYGRLLADAAAKHTARDLMAFTSFAEARTYMHDVLLRDSDQMSMAHGLELRVPLLDHALVEYVMGLPEDLKWPAGVPKRLLVESLGDALPAQIYSQPKRGFVLPFDSWMKGSLRDVCAHYLVDSAPTPAAMRCDPKPSRRSGRVFFLGRVRRPGRGPGRSWRSSQCGSEHNGIEAA